MPGEKVTVSWDEIQSPKVDDRLKLLNSAAAAAAGPRTAMPDGAVSKKQSLLYNAVLYMAFFGLMGGLVGWGLGVSLNFHGSAKDEARDALNGRAQIIDMFNAGQMNADNEKSALKVIDDDNHANAYYQLAINEKLTPEDREKQQGEIESRDRVNDFMSDLLFYGISGMTIAVCLGIAEPMIDRNWRGVTINGAVAAILGLVGGVVVSLFVSRFRDMVVGVIADAQTPLIKQVVADAVQWGTLGLFLGVASGVVLRSVRKIAAGMVGGLLGGIIGGALMEVIHRMAQGNHDLPRLIAICTIGLVAGLGTGLIENAVKTGWLKVTAGLIAGKQFILYRDPTFIGSSLSCHIYLFRDPSVGKRHAAVHIVPGGYEIENLPLGSDTFVNSEPVFGRRRLRTGDLIQIGSTIMMFAEKTAEKKA